MLSPEAKLANGLGGSMTKKAAQNRKNKPKGGGYGSLYDASTPHVQTWKCRHYHKPVTLPDGKIVQASSFTTQVGRRQTAPDYGLYLDRIWMPVEHWRAEFIAWPDFHAPTNAVVAADAVIEAWERIDQGWLIETGCVGGHGRTGTVLAAWTILSGIRNSAEAVHYVWDNYCTEAVESKSQMAWLRWFVEYAAEQGV